MHTYTSHHSCGNAIHQQFHSIKRQPESKKKPKFTRKELIPYVCRSSFGIEPRIYAKASSENSSFSSDVKAPTGDV
jgi:hypothetical protein